MDASRPIKENIPDEHIDCDDLDDLQENHDSTENTLVISKMDNSRSLVRSIQNDHLLVDADDLEAMAENVEVNQDTENLLVLKPQEPGNPYSFLSKLFCVELAVFIRVFSFGLHSVVATDLLLDKACRVDLNFTNEICANINEHSEENDSVQKLVTTFNMYRSGNLP